MKIELSKDQNILTIDDAVYEAKPAKSVCRGCEFEAQYHHVCNHPYGDDWQATACIGSSRNNGQDIIWVEKEVAK